MKWSEKLKFVMKMARDSNKSLAEVLGNDGATVGRCLNGENDIGRVHMLAICKHYGLTLDQLFNDETPLPDVLVQELRLTPLPAAQIALKVAGKVHARTSRRKRTETERGA